MKKLVVLIFILIIGLGMGYSQNITVTSPNGGENWTIGSTHMINWTSSGITGNVGIKLFQNNKSIGYIAQNIPVSSGNYSWTISNVIGVGPISAGLNYQIQIKQNGVAGDKSDGNFTISPVAGIKKPATIFIDEPHFNAAWEKGKSHTIKWTGIGNMVNFVNITLNNYGGNIIIDKIIMNTSNSGMYNWNIPGNIQNGKYTIKVETIDKKISGISKVFNIINSAKNNPNNKFAVVKGFTAFTSPTSVLKKNSNIFLAGQNIMFYSPKTGYVWKPLQKYNITFDVMKKSFPSSSFNFRIKLISANTNGVAFTITNNWSDPNMKRVDKGTHYTYQYSWKFQGSYNIKSGKYKIRVESMNNSSLKQDSEVFSIDSQISNNTGFLGQSNADITVEKVFYDDFKRAFMVVVKNTGFNTYNGPISINYSLTGGQSTQASCPANVHISNSKKFTNISIGKFQSKTLNFMDWKCFGLRSDHLPKNAPVTYSLFVYSNDQSPSVSGYLCKTEKPDIVILNDVFMFKKDGSIARLGMAKKGVLSPSEFNWISNTQFKTKIQVEVANWGCKKVTFPINIHMDGPYLNGKRGITIANVTLGPGESKVVTSNDIIFSVPKQNKYYRFLLVAFQAENSDQGYPNSYMNNFELAFIKMGGTQSGTVRGTGW